MAVSIESMALSIAPPFPNSNLVPMFLQSLVAFILSIVFVSVAIVNHFDLDKD